MYLSVRQVVERLDGIVGKTLIYKLVASRRLRATRVGGKILIAEADLERFLDENANAEKPAAPRRERGGSATHQGVELW